MTEKEALKRMMDRLHAAYVTLRQDLEGHRRGVETCERLMADVAEQRAALTERYSELVRADYRPGRRS